MGFQNVRKGFASRERRGVLVVGASATGVQLAAELRQSGRTVILSVGEHVADENGSTASGLPLWTDDAFDAITAFAQSGVPNANGPRRVLVSVP